MRTWISNTPKSPSLLVLHNDPGYWEWRNSLVEGRPKASEVFSVEELEAVGMIGLYREEEEDNS